MAPFLRWSARILGAAASVFFLAFFAGEGLPIILRGSPIPKELLYFLPLLLVAVAGYIVAWFAETAGGVMLLAGGSAMLVYHLLHGDLTMSLIYGLPFILTGVLFIAHRKCGK
jgi:hypothetical protein